MRNMHVISFETGRIAECFRQLRQAGKPHLGVTPRQQRFVFAGLVYELVQGLMMKSGNCAALDSDHTATHVSE